MIIKYNKKIFFFCAILIFILLLIFLYKNFSKDIIIYSFKNKNKIKNIYTTPLDLYKNKKIEFQQTIDIIDDLLKNNSLNDSLIIDILDDRIYIFCIANYYDSAIIDIDSMIKKYSNNNIVLRSLYIAKGDIYNAYFENYIDSAIYYFNKAKDIFPDKIDNEVEYHIIVSYYKKIEKKYKNIEKFYLDIINRCDNIIPTFPVNDVRKAMLYKYKYYIYKRLGDFSNANKQIDMIQKFFNQKNHYFSEDIVNFLNNDLYRVKVEEK